MCLDLPIAVNQQTRKEAFSTINVCPSQEIFGICPIPSGLCCSLSILEGLSCDAREEVKESLVINGILLLPPRKKYSSRYAYIAFRQKTKYAVVPIASAVERNLFKELMQERFINEKEPNWKSFAQHWSSYADGEQIFYKLPEHLKTFYNAWKEYRASKNAILSNQDVCEQAREQLQSPQRNATPIPAQIPTPVRINRLAENTIIRTRNPPPPHQFVQHPTILAPAPATYPPPAPLVPQQTPQNVRTIILPKRRTRHCTICNRQDCPGRQNRQLCRTLAQG